VDRKRATWDFAWRVRSGPDHVDAFDDYVTDSTNLVALVRSREAARVPLFAGAVIGCLYVLLRQKTLAGFICEDIGKERVMADVLRWLNAHLPAQAVASL
jgi:hypothetical protein